MSELLHLMRGELHPLVERVVVTDQGTAWLPDVHREGVMRELPLCRGLGIAWAPVAEAGPVILYIIGGNPRQRTDEALAIEMPLSAIRTFIRDLESILRQTGAAETLGT